MAARFVAWVLTHRLRLVRCATVLTSTHYALPSTVPYILYFLPPRGQAPFGFLVSVANPTFSLTVCLTCVGLPLSFCDVRRREVRQAGP